MTVIHSNAFIEFRESSIHGTGGFARVAIPAGTEMVEYVGRKIDKAEALRQCELNNPYIFSVTEDYDLDGDVDWNPARLLNHSCSPNAEALESNEHIWITAMRDIAPGEEITFNYNYDLEDYKEHPCQCGSANCVGYIVGEEFFGDVTRSRVT